MVDRDPRYPPVEEMTQLEIARHFRRYKTNTQFVSARLEAEARGRNCPKSLLEVNQERLRETGEKVLQLNNLPRLGRFLASFDPLISMPRTVKIAILRAYDSRLALRRMDANPGHLHAIEILPELYKALKPLFEDQSPVQRLPRRSSSLTTNPFALLETLAEDGEVSHGSDTLQNDYSELFDGFELDDEDEEPDIIAQEGMAIRHSEITSLCFSAGAPLDARGEDRHEASALAPCGAIPGKTTHLTKLCEA